VLASSNSYLLPERSVFRGWWSGFSERGSQDLSNGTSAISPTRQLFSVHIYNLWRWVTQVGHKNTCTFILKLSFPPGERKIIYSLLFFVLLHRKIIPGSPVLDSYTSELRRWKEKPVWICHRIYTQGELISFESLAQRASSINFLQYMDGEIIEYGYCMNIYCANRLVCMWGSISRWCIITLTNACSSLTPTSNFDTLAYTPSFFQIIPDKSTLI
jgi:hypothetical protein